LVAFDSYAGKNISVKNVTYDPTLGLGGSIVMKLLETSNIPPDKGHKIYLDNYFTSVALMDTLKIGRFSLLAHAEKIKLGTAPSQNIKKPSNQRPKRNLRFQSIGGHYSDQMERQQRLGDGNKL